MADNVTTIHGRTVVKVQLSTGRVLTLRFPAPVTVETEGDDDVESTVLLILDQEGTRMAIFAPRTWDYAWIGAVTLTASTKPSASSGPVVI